MKRSCMQIGPVAVPALAGRCHKGGFSFAVVLFAMVVVSALGAVTLQSTEDQPLSGDAMAQSEMALYAAEAWIADLVTTWTRGTLTPSLQAPMTVWWAIG